MLSPSGHDVSFYPMFCEIPSESELQSHRGVTKRYQLNEFKAPFIPDQDMQELPNSKCNRCEWKKHPVLTVS